MNEFDFQPPTMCHKCASELRIHPLYGETGTTYCPTHGDFFVQRLRGEVPNVIFRPFDKAPRIITIEKKAPLVLNIKEEHVATPPLAPRVEWEMEPAEYLASIRPSGHVGRPGTPIRCNQTGTIFSSIREACDELRIQRQTMAKYLKGDRTNAGGYTFTKLDDIYYESEHIRRPPVIKLTTHQTANPIRCVQTNRIFPSIRNAAKIMKLNRDNIRDQIIGNRKDVHGYTFARVTSITTIER